MNTDKENSTRARRTPEDAHAESGCTDYLQHPWESCPENKRKNDPNLNWAMYNPEKANPAHGKPEAPDEAEICRQAGLQAATSNKWNGWDWKAYQTSITRQNHHISKTESHAAQLAEALRDLTEALHHDITRWPKIGLRLSLDAEPTRPALENAKRALAAYEEAQ